MSAITQPVDRDHRPGASASTQVTSGASRNTTLVGARRNDRLLEDELQQVGEGLQQAEGADHVGAAAQLHRRPDLAVGEQDVGDEDQQRDEQQQRSADMMITRRSGCQSSSQRGEKKSMTSRLTPPPA
jgi:hypothetical protein